MNLERIPRPLLGGVLVGLMVGVWLLMSFSQSKGGEEVAGGQAEPQQEPFDPWSESVNGLEMIERYGEFGQGEGGQLSEQDREEIRELAERYALFTYGYLGKDVEVYKSGVESMILPSFWGSPYIHDGIWGRAEMIESGTQLSSGETTFAANMRTIDINTPYADADDARVSLSWVQRKLGGNALSQWKAGGDARATWVEIHVAKEDGQWKVEGTQRPFASPNAGARANDPVQDLNQMEPPVSDELNEFDNIGIKNAWKEKELEIIGAVQEWLDELDYTAYLADADIVEAGEMEPIVEVGQEINAAPTAREVEEPARTVTEIEYVWVEGDSSGRWRTEVEFEKTSGGWEVVEVGETEKLMQDLFAGTTN